MAGELGGWNQTIGTSPYNDQWRQMRRLFHNAIGTPASNRRFNFGKELGARRLLRNLLANPDKFVDHLRLLVLLTIFGTRSFNFDVNRTAATTMLHDTYGYEVVDQEHDPVMTLASEAIGQFYRTMSPPYYLVEFLPWCQWRSRFSLLY